MGNFIFVRHGQSEANAAGAIATPATKLTETGIGQARQTAEKLKSLGITKIVCSPMLRAQQTAETIAAELGIDVAHIEIIDDLQERRFGDHEGTAKTHSTEWYYTSDDEPTSEKTYDLLARMQRCLAVLKRKAENEKLLVVGHGSSGFYLMQAVKGRQSAVDFDPPSQMENADFTVVEYED